MAGVCLTIYFLNYYSLKARHWDITNENNVDLFDARKRPW